MKHQLLRLWLALCGVLLSAIAAAATQATLSNTELALGQTATLTIETDEAVSGTPDLSALERDFTVLSQSSGSQTSIINGVQSTRTSLTLEIEPRSTGLLTIPALQFGSSSSDPIMVTVGAAAPAGAGSELYIETQVGTLQPYVQQVVPYTVKLFYAIGLMGGGVDVPAPEHASLQQVGQDKNYQQDVGGRRYNVFERNYLLVAEKSGPLTIPPAQFRGRARSANVDPFFDRGQSVSAVGEAQQLNVRPQPTGAPQPWLPVASLQLSRSPLNAAIRAGEPVVIELKLNADGVTAAQLPELLLPTIDGAQVFPEPAQKADSITGNRPQASLTRRFALVPAQAGKLHIPELRVGFWNTTTDQADAAVLPALDLDVGPGSGLVTAPVEPAVVPDAAAIVGAGTPADTTQLRLWQAVSGLLAVALAASLWWGWRRSGRSPSTSVPSPSAPQDQVSLKKALAEGDLRQIAQALRDAAKPAGSTLGALRESLNDPGQREALSMLEQQLWAPPEVAENSRSATLERLRHHFRNGVRLPVQRGRAAAPELAPLYPAR